MRNALRSHEMGRFLESAALSDAFDLDAFTSGVLRDRVEAALGLPYCTDFSEETTNRQRAIQLAFEVDQWWFKPSPRARSPRSSTGACGSASASASSSGRSSGSRTVAASGAPARCTSFTPRASSYVSTPLSARSRAGT
jgi:hypothetical protein